MRILLLTHEYPPYIFGGIGVFCFNLANALSESGVEVTVVAGTPSSLIKKKLVDRKVISDNLTVIRVPRIDIPPSHLWYQIMNLSAIKKLIGNFNLVHAQDCSSFPMIYFGKKKNFKVPWIVSIHTGPAAELYYALKSAVSLEGSLKDFITYAIGFPLWDVSLRGHIELADGLVAVSQSLSKELKESYGINRKNLYTIYTGVNIEELENIVKIGPTCSSTFKGVRLFFGGRFYWRKGIIHLLRSVAYLAHEIGFKNFQLQIFGSGPLESKIREFITSLDLAHHILIRGFVKYDKLITSMATSDIVCLPSLYEACPVGMIEAMTLGKPILAFNRPFSRELLGDDPDVPLATSIEEYARYLYLLCISEHWRNKIGERLHRKAHERFDIKNIANSYCKLYRRILSDRD